MKTETMKFLKPGRYGSKEIRAGGVCEVDARHVRVLEAAGAARRHEPQPAPIPPPPTVSTSPPAAARRTYKRRDMQVERAPVKAVQRPPLDGPEGAESESGQ